MVSSKASQNKQQWKGNLRLHSEDMMIETGLWSFNKKTCCTLKTQETNSFWNTETNLSGTKKHAMVKVTERTPLMTPHWWLTGQLH